MGFSSRNRASRGLIVVLGVAIVIGAVSYFYNLSRTRAAKAAAAAKASAPRQADAVPVVPVAATTTPPAALVTQTPAVPKPQSPAATAANPAGPATPSAPTVRTPAALGPVSPSFEKTLAEAKAQADAGKLLPARQALNAALVSGQLSPSDAEAARRQLMQINDRLVFSKDRFADDPHGGIYTVQRGDQLSKIAARHGVTWELLCRVNGMSDPKRLQAGKAIKVVRGPVHAVVNKGGFRMDLYFNSPGGPDAVYLTSFPVGLGKDDSTPTGKWVLRPGGKLKNPEYYSPRGEGVFDKDDPKNPLGEYWLALDGVEGQAVGKESYGIHGTIEPDTIGKQASMGCIRLLNEDVARVYELLTDGKSYVVVKD